MTASLGTLLGDSWSTFRRALVPILIGALIFGLVVGIGQSLAGRRVLQQTGSALENLGANTPDMQALQRRIEAGDQAAMEEFAAKLQNLGQTNPDAIAKGVLSMYSGILPVLGASMIIMWIVSLIASAYFLILSLDEKLAFSVALLKTPKLVIPLFLLSLWIFIRTFLWIPFIGIITGIILGPRFVLAPVLLVKERRGVLESASASYARTAGYWGKTFGNVIVAAICAFVVLVIAGFVVGFLGKSVAGLAAPVLNMLVTAFMTIFMVKLSLTIMQNPKRA